MFETSVCLGKFPLRKCDFLRGFYYKYKLCQKKELRDSCLLGNTLSSFSECVARNPMQPLKQSYFVGSFILPQLKSCFLFFDGQQENFWGLGFLCCCFGVFCLFVVLGCLRLFCFVLFLHNCVFVWFGLVVFFVLSKEIPTIKSLFIRNQMITTDFRGATLPYKTRWYNT